MFISGKIINIIYYLLFIIACNFNKKIWILLVLFQNINLFVIYCLICEFNSEVVININMKIYFYSCIHYIMYTFVFLIII